MIRKRRTFFRRKKTIAASLLSADVFAREIKKEVYRSDRREKGREFGLIRILTDSVSADQPLLMAWIAQIRRSLRITDSIGWYLDRHRNDTLSLGILLPETDKESTLLVANTVVDLLQQQGFDFDTEVSMYPTDDELISLADELRRPEPIESQDDDPPAMGMLKGQAMTRVDDVHQEGPGGGAALAVATLPKLNGESPITGASGESAVRQTRHRFVPSLKTPVWKRGIDVVGAGTGLVLLSPIFLTAGLAIKLNSKGPVFFCQMREGKDGQHFGIIKFRTMVTDAEARQEELRDQSEQDGPAFKLTHDPRVTKVGRYLRKSCVDELPQLINVLKGDMSLVGPRPLPLNESLKCTAWQRARLTVLPGLTCTWQARGGRDVKFVEWMQMDLDYIERQGFWFDLRLIFKTAVLALLHRGSV